MADALANDIAKISIAEPHNACPLQILRYADGPCVCAIYKGEYFQTENDLSAKLDAEFKEKDEEFKRIIKQKDDQIKCLQEELKQLQCLS